ncbi:MAG: hypothetical protein ACREP7_12245 [Lysobacter sp.]
MSGIAPELLAERAAKRGLILPHAAPDTGAMPVQVNPTWLRSTPEALAEILIASAGG